MSNETQALDLIVRGGCVVDGTRAPRYDADIGIAGDRIVVNATPEKRIEQRTIRQEDN